MKIEKINGAYKVRKMIKGKTYVLKFENKPSKRQLRLALLEKIKDNQPTTTQNITLKDAITDYINNKSNVLSPSTLRGYTNILHILSIDILKKNIYDLATNDLQKIINDYTNIKSYKTIKNYLCLINATLNYYDINIKTKLTYPKKKVKAIYIPTDKDIKLITDELRHTKYYIFFRLCLYGLRVSEILALKIDDLDTNGNLNINKAMVQDVKNKWCIKGTKTEYSKRVIKIDNELTTQILNQKYFFTHTYKQFYYYFKATLKKLNINYFNPHKLRHYMATKLHSMNIPSKYIQAIGGWSNDYILTNIYTHTLPNQLNNYKNDYILELKKIIN